MRRYRVVIMLVLFGVLPVVAAFFIALSFLEDPEPEPTRTEVEPVVDEQPPSEPPETRRVVVAARALPAGTLLDDDDLARVELDPDADDSEYFPAPEESAAHPLRGHVVREALDEGAPITESSVVGPYQAGFLATVLRPGTRAVTILLGTATQRAGLVDFGDRVDVILSTELAVEGRDRTLFASTIVEDARVVAIGRRKVVERAESSVGSPEAESGGEPAVATTATLEVTPAQGERLVLGETEGALSLAVRSLATAAAETSSEARSATAVDMRSILLSPSEFSASQGRLRRDRKLDDLTKRKQVAEAERELKAAQEAGATTLETVRIFRGSEPAEDAVFARR